MCYKPLKKLLKHLPSTGDNLPDGGENPPAPLPPPPHLQDWFVRILNEELDKFNDFYVDKEEEFIIRLQVSFLLRYKSKYVNQSIKLPIINWGRLYESIILIYAQFLRILSEILIDSYSFTTLIL